MNDKANATFAYFVVGLLIVAFLATKLGLF